MLTSDVDYTTHMTEHQKTIYYLTGESLATTKDWPFIEVLKKKGFKVLLLVNPIDEYAISQLKEFDGKKLVCILKEGLELEETENKKKECEAEAAKFAELCTTVKDALGVRIRTGLLGADRAAGRWKVTRGSRGGTRCIQMSSNWAFPSWNLRF